VCCVGLVCAGNLLQFIWALRVNDSSFGTVLHLKEDENPVPNEKPLKKSGKQKRAKVVESFDQGAALFEVLKSTNEWSSPGVLGRGGVLTFASPNARSSVGNENARVSQ